MPWAPFSVAVNGDGAAGSSACSSRRVAAPISSRRAGVARCGGHADRPLQGANGVLGFVDPLGALRQAQRDELGEQLVQVTARGGLFRDLAQRRDRDHIPHIAPLDHGRPVVVDDEP